jgi:UDP-3-O-[3-hydroxymyristoyl] glucosamine N-acyltransferase
MKSIYLNDENWNKVKFEYNDISELKEELKKRGITIGYDASIGDDASIGNGASIGYGASIGDDASIGYGASIGNDASIGNRASIGYYASIGDDASIGYGASIGDDVKLQKNLYIVGSKHVVTYTGNNTLSIGCHNYTIDKWLEKFEIVGKKEGYTDAEISEYKEYILMAEKFSKL